MRYVMGDALNLILTQDLKVSRIIEKVGGMPQMVQHAQPDMVKFHPFAARGPLV
jgi:hypothetical protein